MDTSTQYIPIIDFQVYNVNVDKADVSKSALETLSKDVIREFEKVGFCYIINHGITDEFVQRYMSVSRQFFELPRQEKKLYERASKESYHGWIGEEEESLNNKIPGDLKETFNFYPGISFNLLYDVCYPSPDTDDNLHIEADAFWKHWGNNDKFLIILTRMILSVLTMLHFPMRCYQSRRF